MNPNPYVEARGLVDAAHTRLLAWIGEVIGEAGYTGVEVVDDRAPAHSDGTRLLIWPYRVVPWPRRVESTNDLPLLRVFDKQAGVPTPWRALARLLTQALDEVVPPSPNGRPQPNPPLAVLPGPLAAWFRAQGEPWLTSGEGEPRARLPMLMWRPAFLIRSSFLVFAEVAQGGSEIGMTLLATLALAVHRERTLSLELPGPAPEPALSALVEALGEAVAEPLAGELRSAVADLRAPARWNLTLVPFPDLEQEDLAALARAIGRPLRASVHLAVQVPLGAGPGLVPAAGSVAIHSQTMER